MATNQQQQQPPKLPPSPADNRAGLFGQLAQVIAQLLDQGASPDDVREQVDAQPGMSADDTPPDAQPSDTVPDPSSASYKIVHNGEQLSVRLNSRELGVCKRNNLSPANYAKAKARMHADKKDRVAFGIRRVSGGAS